MQEAIDILRHSETVLVNKIKGMKDGKPKYAAADKLNEIREAIKILQYQNNGRQASDGWSNRWPAMPVGH